MIRLNPLYIIIYDRKCAYVHSTVRLSAPGLMYLKIIPFDKKFMYIYDEYIHINSQVLFMQCSGHAAAGRVDRIGPER